MHLSFYPKGNCLWWGKSEPIYYIYRTSNAAIIHCKCLKILTPPIAQLNHTQVNTNQLMMILLPGRVDGSEASQPTPCCCATPLGQLGVPELAPASCVLQPRVVRGVLAWVGHRRVWSPLEGFCPGSWCYYFMLWRNQQLTFSWFWFDNSMFFFFVSCFWFASVMFAIVKMYRFGDGLSHLQELLQTWNPCAPQTGAVPATACSLHHSLLPLTTKLGNFTIVTSVIYGT